MELMQKIDNHGMCWEKIMFTLWHETVKK